MMKLKGGHIAGIFIISGEMPTARIETLLGNSMPPS